MLYKSAYLRRQSRLTNQTEQQKQYKQKQYKQTQIINSQSKQRKALDILHKIGNKRIRLSNLTIILVEGGILVRFRYGYYGYYGMEMFMVMLWWWGTHWVRHQRSKPTTESITRVASTSGTSITSIHIVAIEAVRKAQSHNTTFRRRSCCLWFVPTKSESYLVRMFSLSCNGFSESSLRRQWATDRTAHLVV